MLQEERWIRLVHMAGLCEWGCQQRNNKYILTQAVAFHQGAEPCIFVGRVSIYYLARLVLTKGWDLTDSVPRANGIV